MTRIGAKRKEEIRRGILNISKKLFFENGYDKTSTSQIAKEVGIAEGTIFNYFKTKSEIFLVVFTEVIYRESCGDVSKIDFSHGVADIIFNYIENNFKFVLKLPKKVLREFAFALLSIGKKSPKIISKFAELDYKMMDMLSELIDDLIKKKLIIECDSKALSETIYSVIMFELLIYVYEDERTKEGLINFLKEKILIVIKGYVK